MTILFKPIKPKKISEEIVEQIKALISKGQLKPGERVPSERDLAAMLGVSRPSVREAIMVLDAMGLVESRQGGGTYVRSLTEQSMTDPLTGMVTNNPQLLYDLSEVRIGLESWSAHLAAQNATDQDLAELEKILERMRRLAPSGGWPAEIDTQFHYAITNASHNTIQIHVLNTIHSLFKATIEVALFEFYRREGYTQLLLEQHEAIFSAISAHNPELAQQKMIEHLSIVKQKMSEFLFKTSNA